MARVRQFAASGIIKVELDLDESIEAATGAARRQVLRIFAGSRGHFRPVKGNPFEQDVHAWGAEMAVSLALDLPMLDLGIDVPRHAADVGPYHVRRVAEKGHRLMVRPAIGDPLDEPYILVHGSLPRFYVLGWIWGAEAARPDWLTKANKGVDLECYAVPADHLHRMDDNPPHVLDKAA